MAVTINQTAFETLLSWTFCSNGVAQGTGVYTYALGACGISWCRVFSGTQPVNPQITTGITQVHSGNIGLSSSAFLIPSGGVTRLSGPISFTSNVNTVTASFIRFYGGTIGTGAAIMDVPLSAVPGIGTAVITNTTMQTGNAYSITDLRFGLNAIGQLSVNNAIQNYMLGLLTNKPAIGPVDYSISAYKLAAGSRYQIGSDGSASYTATVPIRAYSGAIPASANDPATGTLLWTKNLTVNDMFVVSGAGMGLVGPMQAAAGDSGTPTYIRITKPAWVSAYGAGPECVIQAPVGSPTNGCIFSPPTLATGVQANMVQFSVILEP